ncbi:MAG: toxin PirB [Serratia symbiotica]|nr:toxin PirB [Serratia symbiotica]
MKKESIKKTEEENTFQVNKFVYQTKNIVFPDATEILKFGLLQGVAAIPTVGPALSKLLSFFWPENESTLWEDILTEVEKMIDEKNLETIQEILQGTINELKTKIDHVSVLVETNPGAEGTRESFVNLSDYMVGLNKKFNSFNKPKVNYAVLPMYSALVSLILSYWINGIENKSEIGLTELDIEKLEYTINYLYDESVNYIEDMYDGFLQDAYNNSDAGEIVNNIMSVHEHIRMNGIEFIDIWENIKENLSITDVFYINTLTYSTFFGRQTSKSKYLALSDENDFPEYLKPNLINKKRNKLKKLICFTLAIRGYRVGGIEVVFEDDTSYKLGECIGQGTPIDLNGRLIKSIEAWGDGAVDELAFHLSDGQTMTFGSRGSDKGMHFYLGDEHHISGLFLSNDDRNLMGQVANFGVSYQLNEPSE